ncbi:MAG: murein biosynthesis integral membrane protein MurJ [Anaerolineae bacterium]
MVIGFVLSRVLGLVRDAVIASIFGNGFEFDAYATALQPPDTLFFVVAGGALGSAFIPTFTAYLQKERAAEAWRMASAVITLIALVVAVLAALFALFARPIIVYVLAPDFPAEKQLLAASLMQIMMLSPVIFSISGLFMALLNSHQRFLLPALAPALYNLGIILGAIFLTPTMGIYGLAWGVVGGALLHLLGQVPGLVGLRMRYRPSLELAHPGVREVLRLMGPRVLGLAIVQINFWVNIRLASGMVEGSVGALRRAWVVLLLPQGIIAQSVANAVFPTFSIHFARGETEKLQSALGQVLRAVLFLSLPSTVGLVMLRLPIVQLLYERNAFTFEDSQATAWALLFYGLGLVAHSLVEIVTRAFYAMHDTRTPVLVGGVAMALNVAFSLLLIQVMGEPGSLIRGPFAGLALANTLATTLEAAALLILIRPRVGGLEERRLGLSLLRAGAASAVMGLALWLLAPTIEALGVYLGTLLGIAAGGVIFWGIAWLSRSEEARLFTGFALRRLRRSG